MPTSWFSRVAAALRHADAVCGDPDAVADAARGAASSTTDAPAVAGLRVRTLALGDPQAPATRVFEILARHGALGEDGRLAPDVHLVAMGDYFDWGATAHIPAARRDGPRVLAWLASHDASAVTLLAGNHDLSRVGELAGFDDDSFAAAHAEATGVDSPAAEAAFLAHHPGVPSAAFVARDVSSFDQGQRAWVLALLARRRLVAAASCGDLLLCHAGVSVDELAALGVPPADWTNAHAVAAALGAAMHRALGAWDGASPLAIPVLHQPGDAATGEGRGIFYHRPCQPHPDDEFPAGGPPPRRRFDARRLPRGLTQVIGHIRDGKCRALLRDWADGQPAEDGPLRTLRVGPDRVRYGRGVSADPSPVTATMLFTDGGMFHADPGRYELLDLDRRRAAPRQ